MGLGATAAPVHQDPAALLLGVVDVAGDAVLAAGVDDRPHVVAQLHGRGARHDAVDDVLHVPDRDHDARRHAALPRAAVGRRHDRVRGQPQLGVGHDDEVVLGAAQAQRPLARRRGPRVDQLGHLGAADEAHGLDGGVVGQRLDHLAAAVDDVEHAVGQARLLEDLGQAHGAVGHLLGRLEDERVPRHQRLGQHPQRHHGGEVEGHNAGDHAERLVGDLAVDAARHVDLLAGGEVGQGGAELHALDALAHRTQGLGDGLAVLVAEQPRQLVLVPLHDLLDPVQDLGPLLHGGGLPGREGRRRRLRRRVHVVGAAEGQASDLLAVAGVVDAQGLTRGRVLPLPTDPVAAGDIGLKGVAAGCEGEGGHGVVPVKDAGRNFMPA
jgi:hypothetical protein